MSVAMLTFSGDNFRLTQSICLLINLLLMRVSVAGYLSAEQVLLLEISTDRCLPAEACGSLKNLSYYI